MKLAVVIEKFDPQGGGAERSTAQIVQQMCKRGHTVTVLCACGETDNAPDGTTVRVMPDSGKLTAGQMVRFSDWVRSRLSSDEFDASLSVTTAAPAMVIQPRSGTAVATQLRNLQTSPPGLPRLLRSVGEKFNGKRSMLRELEEKVLAEPLVRGIAAVSQYVVRQLEEHYPNVLQEKTIRVIPNTAVMPQVEPEQRAQWRERIRDMFHVEDDQTAFLFAALNPRLKGLPQLLAAFARYQERGGTGVLLLAGKIDRSFLRLAERHGVRESVRNVGPTQQMAKLYCASDVTALPTFYDPSSKVVIESLMLGVPAISTVYNGASDFILVDGEPKRGRVVDDPTDIDALCQAMIDLDDPPARESCIENIGDLADQLSIDNHVESLLTLMQDVSQND